MKNIFPRLSRITLKDWLEYHPYDREVFSDRFYIGLSNDIQLEMLHVDMNDNLVGADYKYLACMLACYFEDTVSHTGMWTSFIDSHHRLYGKYLPFYDMTGYGRGDVNLADIQFLIWHFCSNLSIQSHFIDPFSLENTEIAEIVYALLNRAAGQAPRNEILKAALILSPDADFDEVKTFLDFFFFGCYLHQYYTTSLMESEILDVRNQGTYRNLDQPVADRRMHLLFNRVTPLLAQHSGELLAHWAGASHPLYNRLLSLAKRREGFFLYEGETAGGRHRMKHIASGITVELTHPGWKFALTAGKTAVRTGVVQWGDEWHAAGPAFAVNDFKNADIAEEEKYLFAPTASHLGVVKREEECLLEINRNSRILFVENKREAFAFIDRVWEMYHLKYGMDSMDRKMFDVHGATFDVDDDLENLVIFFNPRAGMEFHSDIAQCIAAPDNPYFDKYAEANIEDLMLDGRISSDFISFLINNQMIEIEPGSGKGGFHYVWGNCDFLLRYWKRERYVSEPKLFIN